MLVARGKVLEKARMEAEIIKRISGLAADVAVEGAAAPDV